MTSLDPAAVVAEVGRRFLAGDLTGAFALYHPEIRIEQPASLPHGGWYTGHDGVRRMGADFARHWTRTIGDAQINGCVGGAGAAGLVVQVTTQTWKATSTGRSATVDVVELIRVRDGLVEEIRVFQQDTALLLATLEPA
ncbi:SnoaL-like domain-containing protein [Frankia sp. EI5c]|uniref:nuclear transport factor 2 family protein n=1 Tax=Frankia sp. EI5c TaxID=683316 RepID=UPI0007C3A6C7|nr:nuclear transport factor 2 family protein [Frankia sp. EI5c]OAA26911.1 SnoaL-like domain-containing protein [Frankia sp. EI5c]